MSDQVNKPVKMDANDVAAELGTEGLRTKVEELTAKAPIVGGVAATCRTLGDWIDDPETLNPPPRIPTTYKAIDDALEGGFVMGGMYLLVGLTGRGKSTMALNLARRVAAANTRTLLISLEDAPATAVRRMLAQQSKQPMIAVERYNDPTLAKSHIKAIDSAKQVLRSIPLEIEGEMSDLPGMEALIRVKAAEGTRVFIIDQSSWIGVPGSDSSYEEATEIARRLKRIARSLKAVVIVLVQVNRAGAGAKAAGQDIELHHIRESGRWEQDCDGALVLQTIDDSDDPAMLAIDLKKHRHGPKDRTCRLHFVMPQNLIDDDPNHVEALRTEVKSNDGPPKEKWTPLRFAQEVLSTDWEREETIKLRANEEHDLSGRRSKTYLQAAIDKKCCEVKTEGRTNYYRRGSI